jgi:hypothetical protein
MSETRKPLINLLSGYYGVLQSLHLLVLIRVGVIMLLEARFAFPILAPPTGWQEQTIPFMLGLGVTDTIGILLGIRYAYQSLIRNKPNRRLGILSLTIFITGAVVFAIGTYASGAWSTHPAAYWGMVVLFAPAPWLYFILLRSEKS